MTAHTIGIVANPASGKDVRRLVARASVFDNREKCAIIRRALSGAINAGGDHFAYLDDSHNIAGGALDELVRVTSDDDIAGFLNDKLAAGSGIGLTVISPGADEDLRIAVVGADGTNIVIRECEIIPL